MDGNLSDCDLLARVGRTTEIARRCGVSPQAVSQWRKTGLPNSRRQYLALLVSLQTTAQNPATSASTHNPSQTLHELVDADHAKTACHVVERNRLVPALSGKG